MMREALPQRRRCETISFRVGRYVGDYAVWVDDPPEIDDGFFMPLDVHDLLEIYVINTDISKLRDEAVRGVKASPTP